MKILLILGTVWPLPSNNANILKKLIPHLSDNHTVHILAPANQTARNQLPEAISGVPVHWMIDNHTDLLRRVVYPGIARVTDRNGFSDAMMTMLLIREAKKIQHTFAYDGVISVMEPYAAGFAAAMLPRRIKKVLYLLDPPGCVCDENNNTPFRQRNLRRIFKKTDAVLTTPFIIQALAENSYARYCDKMHPVGFPMIHENENMRVEQDIKMDPSKVNILFCGWLCSEIRSPQYFLDIAARLDDRFCVYFMGKECDKLRERFAFETKAQVITLPQQPYQVALNAMADADILVNIGNSIPVHMPSKTLEYINTGKPMVNFHKLTDCPTLHYTNRYPLCLNMWEGERDTEQAADAFIRFCTENKGRTTGTASLKTQLPECTPEYIAKLILEKIGAHYE